MPYILSEMADRIGTITFDHERRRNALSHGLVEETIAALRSFRETKARVAILRAKPGSRVFSAATMLTSCRRPGATRSGGMIPCASSCARSRAIPPR